MCLGLIGHQNNMRIISSTSQIDDIAFELFAMHCGIGWGIRQKKIPQEK